MNTGALVNRMNFALQLAGNKLRGGRSRPVASDRRPAGTSATALRRRSERIVETVLNDDVSDTTRDTIAKATTRRADAGADARLAGISETLRSHDFRLQISD